MPLAFIRVVTHDPHTQPHIPSVAGAMARPAVARE